MFSLKYHTPRRRLILVSGIFTTVEKNEMRIKINRKKIEEINKIINKEVKVTKTRLELRRLQYFEF